ncbi:MAG TPA: type II CAAX endopeptidase family protein, partial [Gemmatimonadales bacterium]|nr:type II CAAX endopeptidase family protein [Gemmatimonadales bacterium]
SIAFLVLTFLTAGFITMGAGALLTGSLDRTVEWLKAFSAGTIMIQAIAALTSTALFTWLIGFRRLGLSRADLRYAGWSAASPGLRWGLMAGGLTAGLALLIAVVAGQARWVKDAGDFGEYIMQALKTVALLAPAALSEELIFRGVPLVLLAAALGRGSAVVATSLVFALAHISNPNATPLGLGNIALAGIFLGLTFYAPGGIWTAFGAHWGWNSVLACLDTPVSGLPFRIPMLDYNAGAPGWLTGGTFGPEGGLAATLALTIAIVVTARLIARAPS